MRTRRAVVLLIALLLPALRAESAVYTRYVQQLTGSTYQVTGQDGGSPATYSSGGVTKTFFFFGDSYIGFCNPSSTPGCTTPYPTNPNTYASTIDGDASDGLAPLVYFPAPNNPFKAGTALATLPDEGSVWPGSAFQIGADLYVFYLAVYPFQEGQSLPDSKEKGIAKITNGTGPMVRTGTAWTPNETLAAIGGAIVDGGYLYVYGQAPTGFFGVFLARAPLASVLDKNAYEYWTTGGWSPTAINLVTLFDNSSQPVVRWNASLGKCIGMSGVPFSAHGIWSEVTIRTADALTGPWSAPTQVVGIPQTGPGFFGSVYLPGYTNALDRNGGRTLYFTASDGGIYNVVLYEANLDKVTSALRPQQNADDARESLTGTSLHSPVLNQDDYELNGNQENVIGLRMTGLTYYDASPTVPTLTLSLKNPPPSTAIDVTIKVEMGVPNEGPFTNALGNISLRTRLGSQTQNVHIVPGQSTVVINAATLGPLFDLARADPNWDNGRSNAVLLYLSRTDSVSRNLNLRAYSGTIPPVLDTCYGTPCP